MQIKRIDYTPDFVKNFGDTNECERYAVIVNDIIVAVIFKIDNEIGFYTDIRYRNRNIMYNALKMFVKPNYTFTVLKSNKISNHLLEKLKFKKINESYLFNFYKS